MISVDLITIFVVQRVPDLIHSLADPSDSGLSPLVIVSSFSFRSEISDHLGSLLVQILVNADQCFDLFSHLFSLLAQAAAGVLALQTLLSDPFNFQSLSALVW